MNKLKLAVIGKDVSKSDSPGMHMFIADKLGYKIEYDKISIPEDRFEHEIDSIIKGYDGFNVTIPYKLSIISRLKNVLDDAKIFGAVNTVDCKKLSGFNTDGLGFMLMLKNNEVNVSGKRVLLLGAGGAGRSVAKKLADVDAKVYVYDKNFCNAQSLAAEFVGVTALKEIETIQYFAIINATGVGMHNTEGISPVDGDLLGKCEVAIDLIYAPPKSEFLKIAETLGKKIINGSAMLFYQAYYAECIYHGVQPDELQAKEMFNEYTGKKL